MQLKTVQASDSFPIASSGPVTVFTTTAESTVTSVFGQSSCRTEVTESIVAADAENTETGKQILRNVPIYDTVGL